jgi:hypothetical protein
LARPAESTACGLAMIHLLERLAGGAGRPWHDLPKQHRQSNVTRRRPSRTRAESLQRPPVALPPKAFAVLHHVENAGRLVGPVRIEDRAPSMVHEEAFRMVGLMPADGGESRGGRRSADSHDRRDRCSRCAADDQSPHASCSTGRRPLPARRGGTLSRLADPRRAIRGAPRGDHLPFVDPEGDRAFPRDPNSAAGHARVVGTIVGVRSSPGAHQEVGALFDRRGPATERGRWRRPTR